MKHAVLTSILIILAGVFAILASAFDWDFFFENRRAKIFIKIFGRQGSRIFYSIIGLVVIFIGIKML